MSSALPIMLAAARSCSQARVHGLNCGRTGARRGHPRADSGGRPWMALICPLLISRSTSRATGAHRDRAINRWRYGFARSMDSRFGCICKGAPLRHSARTSGLRTNRAWTRRSVCSGTDTSFCAIPRDASQLSHCCVTGNGKTCDWLRRDQRSMSRVALLAAAAGTSWRFSGRSIRGTENWQ